MTPEELLKQLEDWHAKGKHEEIADTLLALPEDERDYNLTSLLARALNNLSRYELALLLLDSVREQGQDDPYWHFRMGYSLFYMDDRETEAIPYLERAIELGDDYPSTYELLLNAREYAKETQSSDVDDVESTLETSFEPKAYVTLSLNMRLQPQHRALYLEDGLDFMFRSRNWGCVSGGGTLLSKEGELEACDIEIDLADDSEEMRQNLLSFAQKLEVAKGSKLKYRSAGKEPGASEHDVEYPTGNLEGLAIYLNGTDLPDKVYEENDINDVIDELLNLLSNNGALVRSYWEGANETALYFYGEGDFDTMLKKVTPFLNEHPLCQKCRTVRIA